MDDNKTQAPNNVIQFPGRRKEAEPTAPTSSTSTPGPTPAAKPKKKRSKKNVTAGVLAVVLASFAANRVAFKPASANVGEQSFASVSGSPSRLPSSVSAHAATRNAEWEKQLAERLASEKVRDVASLQVGRPATMEERLRWGTLEEKYTITYRADVHEIDSILLQDSSDNPAYILDRHKFLKDYARLFNAHSALLKSVEESSDKTVEAYTLYDGQKRAKGEARFELDRHKRLLSLKVEPSKI